METWQWGNRRFLLSWKRKLGSSALGRGELSITNSTSRDPLTFQMELCGKEGRELGWMPIWVPEPGQSWGAVSVACLYSNKIIWGQELVGLAKN